MVESSHSFGLTTAFHWLKSCLKDINSYTQNPLDLSELGSSPLAAEPQCACFIDSSVSLQLLIVTLDTLFVCVHNVYSLQRTMHNGRGDPCTARFLFMAFKGSFTFNFGSEINKFLIKKTCIYGR